jgi:hypothetical protein
MVGGSACGGDWQCTQMEGKVQVKPQNHHLQSVPKQVKETIRAKTKKKQNKL